MGDNIKVIREKEDEYFEVQSSVELEINGKKVTVNHYEKQHPAFGDYECETEIAENDEKQLTEEESETICTYVEDNYNWT